MSVRVLTLGFLITLGSTAWTAATDVDTLLIAYALQDTHGTFYAIVFTIAGQRRKPKHAADGIARIASQKLFHDSQFFGSAPRVRPCTRGALRVIPD